MALPKEFTTVTTLSKILAGTLFVAMPFAGFYLGMKYQESLTIAESTTPVATESSKSATKPGATDVKKYVDNNLKYGFSYPASAELTKCGDEPCAFFNQYDLRIQPLRSYSFSASQPSGLLQEDLYCSAGGPGTSINCTNTKMEAFTSTSGATGYKVYRSVAHDSNGSVTESFAYVFPISGSTKYTGVLIALDPNAETSVNQAFLTQIINSFVNL